MIAPIRDGLAVLGSMDKLNPGGTVVGFEQVGHRISARFRDGGRALFYCRRRPTKVTVEGETVNMLEYHPDTGALIVDLQHDGAQRVVVELPG